MAELSKLNNPPASQLTRSTYYPISFYVLHFWKSIFGTMNTGNPDPRRHNQAPMGLVNTLSRTTFPTVESYVAFSVLMAIIASVTVFTTFRSQPELQKLLEEELRNNTRLSSAYGLNIEALSGYTLFQIAHYILSDTALIWIAINSYFAILAVCTKLIIRLTFKELNRQEENVARQSFFSYVLLTIVYLSVVTGPQKGNRVMPWMIWAGVCGFLSHLQFITCERLKNISPACDKGSRKISLLSLLLFFVSIGMSILITRVQNQLSWQPALLLYSDCVLAVLRSTYILFRCISSSRMFSFNPDSVRHFNYWLEFVTNFVCEVIQMLSFIQLFAISPGLNLTSIFFLYHMRLTFNCIDAQLTRHRSHKMIFEHIEKSYPSVKCTNGDDRCVVCWEILGTSRRLPCSHQFHDWCLMWWLSQDSSCPTCRCSVPSPESSIRRPVELGGTRLRFNGGQFGFVRFPAFTLEVATGFGPFFGRASEPTEEQLQGMLEQVREMFPQMTQETIMTDLRQSGSAQSTIENILEGRIGMNAPLMPGVLDGEITEESEVDTDYEENAEMVQEPDNNRQRTWTTLSSSSETDNISHFEAQRAEMIKVYRKKYLASDKAADLRAIGITE